MMAKSPGNKNWLPAWLEDQRILLWGAADLREFLTPADASGQRFPRAIAWALPIHPPIMASVKDGPNQEYAEEYSRVNKRINELAHKLSVELRSRGHRAQPLAASERTDTTNIMGDFPHKTAATRAGIGWIGRHCQLVTSSFGSWVRLGTVFTDMEIDCARPLQRNFCGRCRRCVDACPARAVRGNEWYPGITREQLLDAHQCDQWKKAHYYEYHKGRICGICSAVCPYGTRLLRDRKKGRR